MSDKPGALVHGDYPRFQSIQNNGHMICDMGVIEISRFITGG
jgi:hypothetical protein